MCASMTRSARAGVARLDRREDRLVLSQRVADHRRRRRALVARAAARPLEQDPGDALGQTVAGDGHHGLVEAHVRGVEDVGVIDRATASARGVLRRMSSSAGARTRAVSPAMAASSRARTIVSSSSTPSVLSCAMSEVRTTWSIMFHDARRLNDGASALDDADQTLLFQSLDRLAQHRAADPELLAQGQLGWQRVARRQLPGDDDVDERPRRLRRRAWRGCVLRRTRSASASCRQPPVGP